MSASVAERTHSHRLSPSLPVVASLLVGLATGLIGYVVHHLPLLHGHPVLATVLVMTAAASLVAGLAGVLLARRAAPPPQLVVVPLGAVGLRPLDHRDLRFAAGLHAEALPHGFFVELGPGFLRAYLATFLDSPHAVALLATLGGHPVGTLVGVLDPARHARWVLRRRGLDLAWRGALALAVRPRVALRFLRTRVGRYVHGWRRHRKGPPVAAPEAGGRLPAVLSHVAVLPGARGTGAGAALVKAFEEAARGSGALRAILTTMEGPDGAGAFYSRLGWERTTARRTHDGLPMEEWARTLTTESGTG